MKFSGKMHLMIILKVTKNQRFTFCSEDAFFGKPQGRSNWPAVLGLTIQCWFIYSVTCFNERNKAKILSFNFKSKKLNFFRSCFKKDKILLEICCQMNKRIRFDNISISGQHCIGQRSIQCWFISSMVFVIFHWEKKPQNFKVLF